LVEHIICGAANLKYTILEYSGLPATETLWLQDLLSLSSKGSCMRQEGHSFLQASSAEAPGKPEDGPLEIG